jgi:hypothetical protein
MKTCTKCQEVKSLDQFYKRSDRDAYHSWCKSCKHLAGKSWHRRNKERHNELTKRWYEENREQHLSNSREWYAANRHRKLATTSAREERCKQATPIWVDMTAVQELYRRAQEITEQTGIPHEVDHIVPLTHEAVCGLNAPANLQILTQEQNRRKANKLVGLD